MTQKPTIGRVVIYVSRTGSYEVPAIVNCTQDTLYQPGVEAGFVPPLSGDYCVHLTVLTPGKPGKRVTADDFVNPSAYPISENVAGCYQEWDIPHSPTGDAGTWHWPERV